MGQPSYRAAGSSEHQWRFWHGRRIVVTGGSGFIGSRVVYRLGRAGAHVLSVDVEPPTIGLSQQHRMELCDIRSEQFAMAVAGFRPHAIVHLAAQIDVADSMRRPARDADVNVRGTIAVAEAAITARAELLVFAASCAIYGQPVDLPVTEHHRLAPTTPYGLSKAAALSYVEWYAQHRGLPSTSLILGNVYGRRDHGSADRGGVISRFLADATAGRPSVIRGGGTATRDYVHVEDVADAVVRACGVPGSGRINIGSGTETSVLEVHKLVGRVVGRAVEPRNVPALPGEIERMCLCVDRALAVLGWSVRIRLEQGITRIVPDVVLEFGR